MANKNYDKLIYLTLREQNVMEGLAQGRAYKEIALDLGLAEPTVKWYTKRLFDKFNCSNRLAVVIKAHRQGILNLDEDICYTILSSE